MPGAIHPRDAVWALDVRREPYLLIAAATAATSRVSVGTNVAVAFARSPTATACAAWDLALWGGGRFVLGLGSQVGPTLMARFGVQADHPAPRMRDYIAAVRACFGAFRSGHGRYEGEFYEIRRPALQPGADDLATDPPIYLAAVNPLMTAVAGEVADGLAAHPFTTSAYVNDVMRPALALGAARSGRPLPKVLLQLVVAPTREAAARQMVAYTVPGYRRVLDHEGLGDLADGVMAAAAAGRRSEAAALVDRGFLDRLAVVIDDSPGALVEAVARWAPLADRLSLSVPWYGTSEADQLVQIERLIDHLPGLTQA
ncbi:MAG: LLM class flavin-dependent oxidoreductase [Candidatus Dormibacteraeota bacterium]|nr:LLM class flavin-dependent oxidoreductase [Candidatus Dormibacteraeota bacterium]